MVLWLQGLWRAWLFAYLRAVACAVCKRALWGASVRACSLLILLFVIFLPALGFSDPAAAMRRFQSLAGLSAALQASFAIDPFAAPANVRIQVLSLILAEARAQAQLRILQSFAASSSQYAIGGSNKSETLHPTSSIGQTPTINTGIRLKGAPTNACLSQTTTREIHHYALDLQHSLQILNAPSL